MMRLLVFVFSATLFSFVLVQEASALRGGGIHVGGGGLRGFSAGAYRGGLRTRNFNGYRAAAWGGRRSWRGARRWYGVGAGAAVLAGAYYNDPYYDDAYYSDTYNPTYGYTSAYSGSYGYSRGAYGYSSSTAAEADAGGPGTCGTYRYWKNGQCVDARGK